MTSSCHRTIIAPGWQENLEKSSRSLNCRASPCGQCISSSSVSSTSTDIVAPQRDLSIAGSGSNSSRMSGSLLPDRKPSKKSVTRAVRPFGSLARQRSRRDSVLSSPEGHQSLVRAVQSPELHRIQLQAEFIHYHFPWTAQEPHFVPNQKIIMHQTKTVTLQTALDALYLIQVGSKMRNERIIMHGRLSYQAALQRVRRDLSRPDAYNDDSLLAAIHMLATCEKYEALDYGVSEPAQRPHLNGAAHMLQMRGPLSIRTEIQQYQLQQHLLHALFQGCMTRKTNVFGSEEWAAATANCGPIATLINQCLRVPTLLDQVDSLLETSTHHDPATMKILGLLMALQKLETELQTWLTIWNKETHQPSSYREVSSEDFPFYHTLPDEVAQVFPESYEFNSFTCASVHSVCWFSTMLLREAYVIPKATVAARNSPIDHLYSMKDVQALQPWSAFKRQDQSKLIDREVDEAADQMCKCVFYLAQQEHGTHGFSSACAPSRFAAQWYGRNGDERKLTWCNKCLTHVDQVHGVRAKFLIWQPEQRIKEVGD